MECLYYASSLKPTAINGASVGSFTGPRDRNLVVAKNNRIEVSHVTENGVEPFFDLELFGRIACMQTIRLSNQDVDLLMVVTENCQFMVLCYCKDSESIRTIAAGDLRDRIGRRTDTGPLAAFDPQGRCAILQFYDGMLKVIPCLSGFTEKAYNVRIDQRDVVGVCFLQDSKTLHSTYLVKGERTHCSIAVLCSDSSGNKRVVKYNLDLSNRTLTSVDNPLPQEPGSNLIYSPSLPLGGLLVFGPTQTRYYNRNGDEVFTTDGVGAVPTVVGSIDAWRYLVGTASGELFLCFLELDNDALSSASTILSSTTSIKGVGIKRLGSCSVPSAIVYLDNGFIFVASTAGNSQIIKLHSQPINDENDLIEEISTYTNLGPIVDMVCRESGDGSREIITASGIKKGGSIQCLRPGIPFITNAEIDAPPIKNSWAVKESCDSIHDKYLVQSHAYGTTILQIVSIDGEDELTNVTLPGIHEDEETLYAGVLDRDSFVHVSTSRVSILSLLTGEVHSTWSTDEKINCASGYLSDVLLGLGPTLIHLTVDRESICCSARTKFLNSISTLTTTCVPLYGSGSDVQSTLDPIPRKCILGAVGLWGETKLLLFALNLAYSPTMRLDLSPYLAETSISNDSGEPIRSQFVFEYSPKHMYPVRSIVISSMFESPSSIDLSITLPADNNVFMFLGFGDGTVHVLKLALQFSPTYQSLGARERISGSDKMNLDQFHAGTEDANNSAPLAVISSRILQIGSGPVSLAECKVNGTPTVLAVSDSPQAITIHRRNNIITTPITVGPMESVSVFNPANFGQLILLSTRNSPVIVGTLAAPKKYHITSFRLGHQPRRLCQLTRSNLIAVSIEIDPQDTSSSESQSLSSSASSVHDLYPNLSSAVLFLHSKSLQPCLIPNYRQSNDEPIAIATSQKFPKLPPLHTLELVPFKLNEVVTCMIDIPFSGESSGEESLLAIGTAVLDPDVDEATRGYVYFYSISLGYNGLEIQRLSSINCKGGVFELAMLSSDTLAFSVNEKVRIWNISKVLSNMNTPSSLRSGVVLQESEMEMSIFTGSILVTGMRHYEDSLFVADMMKGITKLECDDDTKEYSVTAQSSTSLWLTAIQVVNKNLLIGATHSGSLILCRPTQLDQSIAQSRVASMEIISEFVTGDYINKYIDSAFTIADKRHLQVGDFTGKFSSESSDVSSRLHKQLLSILETSKKYMFGCISGRIGTIITLPRALFQILLLVQEAMDAHLSGIGGLSQSSWRGFHLDERRNTIFQPVEKFPSGCFIDGDFLSPLLDLEPTNLQFLVDHVNSNLKRDIEDIDDSSLSSSQAPNRLTCEDLVRILYFLRELV